MATRKTTGRRATRSRAASRKQAGRSGSGQKKRPKKKRTSRSRPPAKPSRQRAKRRRRAASLAERLTELVEHAAAAALRRVAESGGRKIAAWAPEAMEMRREAGVYLRELRELAGLTLDELADAAELRDRSLLESVEAGTATLSFELILRLAAILARHDPVPFVSRLVRSYNPVLWQLLEDWGIGRLPIQLERERAFVNILRGHDQARALPDADFEQMLEFTRTAFETALHFAATSAGGEAPNEEG
jgi:transcriptional regulator with XRE-family HTH domain